MIRGISILGVAERFEAVVAAAMTLGWFLPLEFAPHCGRTLGETLHQGMGTAHSVVDRSTCGRRTGLGKGGFSWFSALGALVFWCLLPLLGRRRAPVEKRIKFRKRG